MNTTALRPGGVAQHCIVQEGGACQVTEADVDAVVITFYGPDAPPRIRNLGGDMIELRSGSVQNVNGLVFAHRSDSGEPSISVFAASKHGARLVFDASGTQSQESAFAFNQLMASLELIRLVRPSQSEPLQDVTWFNAMKNTVKAIAENVGKTHGLLRLLDLIREAATLREEDSKTVRDAVQRAVDIYSGANRQLNPSTVATALRIDMKGNRKPLEAFLDQQGAGGGDTVLGPLPK